MNRILKKYDITQCAFYKCSSKKMLAKLLEIDIKELKNLQNIIYYHRFSIKKKNTNEERDISEPQYKLKKIQKRILSLLQCIIRPDWLMSGEKGKSYKDNGIFHVNSDYCLTMDIRNFYDNCNRNFVYQFFKLKMFTSSDVAEILTDIVTYNNIIPTGSPTSQLIAYYSYEDMFNELKEFAKQNECIFSLYVDDMTFSSNKPLSKKIFSHINKILHKYGHRLKFSKVKSYDSNKAKLITGVIITKEHKIMSPNYLQKRAFETFQSIKHLQSSSSCSKEELKKVEKTMGYIQVVRNIDPNRMQEMYRITKNILKNLKS